MQNVCRHLHQNIVAAEGHQGARVAYGPARAAVSQKAADRKGIYSYLVAQVATREGTEKCNVGAQHASNIKQGRVSAPNTPALM